MGPKSYSEILFRKPIPKSYSETLFRNPIPKSYSEILFRNPIPKSYSEILFRNPIPKSYSEILFRNPIPKSYSEILFQNSSLQDLGTGMGGTSGSATCLARNAHFTTRICHPKSSPQFPNSIPKSYSEILFRNPIPKSYSETLVFRIQAPEWGGDPGSATCVTKNTHFTNRICHPKSSPQFPELYSQILFPNPIPKSYSEILFRNPIPKSYSPNPIPKSYSEILFRNPIPKPQSLGFRHRNGGGPRIGHLRNKKHTFYEQNLSSKIQSSIPKLYFEILFRNPIPKSYSEILFRNPIPKSYSPNPIPKSYSEILFRNPIPKPQSLGFRHRNGGGPRIGHLRNKKHTFYEQNLSSKIQSSIPITLFRNPIPKSYSEILFRNPIPKSYSEILNPIPKSYSEILFRNPIPKPQSLGFRHRNGGGPRIGHLRNKKHTFYEQNLSSKIQSSIPRTLFLFRNPIPKSYSEILFRNPIPKSYSPNPIPKSYSEILFRNPIPKPQSLGFRHRNGGGPRIGHLRNKKHTFYEQNLSSKIKSSIPITLFRNPIPKSYSEILFRNPIPKSYSEILKPKS